MQYLLCRNDPVFEAEFYDGSNSPGSIFLRLKSSETKFFEASSASSVDLFVRKLHYAEFVQLKQSVNEVRHVKITFSKF